MKKVFAEFSINCCILVKFNDNGYQKLACDHNSYIGKIPSFEFRTAEYYKRLADKEGYSRVQAWSFFNQFGEVTRMGCIEYYAATIKIDQDDLTGLSAWALIKKYLKILVKKVIK